MMNDLIHNTTQTCCNAVATNHAPPESTPQPQVAESLPPDTPGPDVSAASEPPQRGFDLVVTERFGRERRYHLGDIGMRGLRIGREANADISIPDDAFLSFDHARLVQGEGGWYLVDQGSFNGTFVRLTDRPLPLRAGVEFVAGTTRLCVVPANTAIESTPQDKEGAYDELNAR